MLMKALLSSICILPSVYTRKSLVPQDCNQSMPTGFILTTFSTLTYKLHIFENFFMTCRIIISVYQFLNIKKLFVHFIYFAFILENVLSSYIPIVFILHTGKHQSLCLRRIKMNCNVRSLKKVGSNLQFAYC